MTSRSSGEREGGGAPSQSLSNGSAGDGEDGGGPLARLRRPRRLTALTRPADFEIVEVGPPAHGGHCVARLTDGRVAFVRHALPGERVRLAITEERRTYVRADAVEILSPSPDRVEPPCPYAGPGRCGGCDLQHASPAAQLEWKAAVVREQLARLSGLTSEEIEALPVRVSALEPRFGWRTRVRYAVAEDGSVGLLRHRSHEVQPVDRCLIAAGPVPSGPFPANVSTVEVVASSGGDLSIIAGRSRKGPIRVVERAIGREWTVDARAFWQVHPAAADTFAAAVLELLDPRPSERAWDLYGGAGLFAAALAPRLTGTGRITVVEADPLGAAAARRNLRDLTTVTVVESTVEDALANPRWRAVDLVVLDPPRSGAGREVVDAIIARGPRAVAYVACDPAALARDIRAFRDGGYQLTELRAYDAFPQTHHVECIARLAPTG